MMAEAILTRSACQARGHYSQAVRAGKLLFISGQLPFDPEGRLVKGKVTDEARQALANVQAIVEAAGGKLANVVQCTVYISDLSFWDEVDRTYADLFSDVAVLPARAVVPVKDLHYGARIEVQAVAVMDDEPDASSQPSHSLPHWPIPRRKTSR